MGLMHHTMTNPVTITIEWGAPAPRKETDTNRVSFLTTPQQVRYNGESTDDETGEEPHA